MSHILEIDSVQLAFAGRRLLADIYLRCATGSITGLLGRNGAGKSCLLELLYGTRAGEKSVRLDQRYLPQAYQRPELVRYLPQAPFMPAHLTLQRVFQDFLVDYAAFIHWFPAVQLPPTTRMGALSGGTRRLVELFALVCSDTQFVLLDEPFTHLSPLQIEQVKALVRAETRHKGFVVTDHQFRHVLALSDTVTVLVEGTTYPLPQAADLAAFGYARA